MSKRSPNTYTKIHTIFRRSERGIIQPEEPLSVPEFEYLRKCYWHCEEKVDGTNIRIEIYLADVGDGLMRRCVRFQGKTDNAQIPPQLLAYLQQEYTAAKILAALGWQEYEQIMPDYIGQVEATIYGEGYGKGIQKGAGYSESQKFVAFDVKVGESFLDVTDRDGICERAGIPVVPCFGQMTIDEAILCVAIGFDSRMPGANCQAEGFVLRPLVRLKDARGARIITKIKHVDFERTTKMAKANFQEDEAGYIEREADFLAEDTRKACKEYFDAKRDKKRAEKARKILHVFANAQELCKNFKIHDDSSGQKWKYKRASVILKDAANERLPLCYTMVKESERMSETDKHKMAKYVFSIARDIRKMIASELEDWNENKV